MAELPKEKIGMLGFLLKGTGRNQISTKLSGKFL
jgi:hypothetical protein